MVYLALDSDWLIQECSTAHWLEPDFDRYDWLVLELTADWLGLDIHSYCMGKETVVSDKC